MKLKTLHESTQPSDVAQTIKLLEYWLDEQGYGARAGPHYSYATGRVWIDIVDAPSANIITRIYVRTHGRIFVNNFGGEDSADADLDMADPQFFSKLKALIP